MAEVLKHNSTLTSLHLQRNYIGVEGGKAWFGEDGVKDGKGAAGS